MKKQTITKEDGRYLIFYTFDAPPGNEESPPAPPAAPPTQQPVASENVADDVEAVRPRSDTGA